MLLCCVCGDTLAFCPMVAFALNSCCFSGLTFSTGSPPKSAVSVDRLLCLCCLRGSRGSAILPLPHFRLNSTCLSMWCSGSPVEGSRLWMSHSGYVGQGCSTADPGAAGWPLPKSGILCLCLVIGALCHPVESTFCVCAAGSEIHIHS